MVVKVTPFLDDEFLNEVREIAAEDHPRTNQMLEQKLIEKFRGVFEENNDLRNKLHPWYGPCDGIANGECAECANIEKFNGMWFYYEEYRKMEKRVERLEKELLNAKR